MTVAEIQGGLISDNFVGLVYEKVVLGLDATGNGKHQSSNAFAGIPLMIPVAIVGKTDVRFKRLNEKDN